MKNKNKITTTSVCILILAIIVLSGCENQPITGQVIKNNQNPVIEKNPVKVGATLALSGSLAYIGVNELNGLQMAVDEINAKDISNNVKFKLIVEDNKGDAKEAVTTVHKLINTDEVDVMFSAFTQVTNSVKGIVFDSGKIFMYASTYPNIARENNNTFRDYFDAGDHGWAMARVVKNNRYTNVYFLTEKSDQCALYEKSFNEEAKRLGIKIITREEYQVSDQDLKTNIIKLNMKKGNALVTCAWRHQTILMKQLKELNMLQIQTFHMIAPYFPAAITPEMRKIYQENNAITSWYGFGETKNTQRQQEFIDKYKSKYGIEPTPDAAYAYDDIYILANAINACNSDIQNKKCIVEQLKFTNYDGVGGHLAFNDERLSNREVIFMQIVEDKWQMITK